MVPESAPAAAGNLGYSRTGLGAVWRQTAQTIRHAAARLKGSGLHQTLAMMKRILRGGACASRLCDARAVRLMMVLALSSQNTTGCLLR